MPPPTCNSHVHSCSTNNGNFVYLGRLHDGVHYLYKLPLELRTTATDPLTEVAGVACCEGSSSRKWWIFVVSEMQTKLLGLSAPCSVEQLFCHTRSTVFGRAHDACHGPIARCKEVNFCSGSIPPLCRNTPFCRDRRALYRTTEAPLAPFVQRSTRLVMSPSCTIQSILPSQQAAPTL